MTKSALVVIFALVLVLSIQSVVGDDVTKESAQSMAENAEDTSSSWSSWAKDQLKDFGLLSPKETVSAGWASAPENAPAPGYSSSDKSELAAAPSY